MNESAGSFRAGKWAVLYQLGIAPGGVLHTWLRETDDRDEAMRQAGRCREAMTRSGKAVWDVLVVRVEIKA